MISDIVLLKELPAALKNSIEAYVGCIAGATSREEYLATIAAAGFQEVEIVGEISARGLYDSAAARAIADNLGTEAGIFREAADSIVSMKILAVKPAE